MTDVKNRESKTTVGEGVGEKYWDCAEKNKPATQAADADPSR